MNKRTIAGIEFEAVRFTQPLPHWRPRITATGETIEAGIFPTHSRPAMWDGIEYMAQRIGYDRLRRDLLGG